MKNIFFVLIIFTFGCTPTKNTSIQKGNDTTVQKDFMTYLQAIADKDFATSMEFLIPEFFEIFPKADMIKIMEETFNNPLMTFNVKNPKIIEVADVESIDGKFYTKMTYKQELEMKMQDDETESEAEKKLRIDDEKRFFKQSFGEDNVEYNAETGYFIVKAQEEAIAVSMDGKTDWKFLVIQEKQKAIAKSILSEEVLERFGVL